MARFGYIQVFVHCIQTLIWDYSLAVARMFNKLRNAPSLKPTNRREITYLIGMAEEDDRRPESSPFAGFTTQVYFHEGPEFVVPTSLIRKCPKLIPDGTRWPPSAIRLDDITSDIAHVIFYYLLTGTYQSLRPKGNSHNERLGNELRTGVQAYNAARSYELPPLQELAKDEIQRLSQELPFPLVLNLLRNLQLDPSERETWLDDYVQSGLKDLFQTPTAFLDLTTSQVEHDVVSFSNIILKSLANLLANDGAIARRDNVEAPPAASSEPAAIEEEHAHAEEPTLQDILGRQEEPASEAEAIRETAEPAPSMHEREPSIVAEPEPIEEQPLPKEEPPYEPTYERSHHSAHEQPVHDSPPELQTVDPVPEPEPEAEVESPPRAKDSPTEDAFNPSTWGWGGTTTTQLKGGWPEDEPVSSPPDPISSPADPVSSPPDPVSSPPEPAETPAPDPPEAAPIEYPEPVPVRDFSHVLEHRPDSQPTEDDTLPPLAEPKKTTNSSKKKKTLSLFRGSGSPAPETPPRVETPPPRVETPNLEQAPPPLESRPTDDSAMFSPGSSSGMVKKATKKKKKRSIFRSEEPV
ncbi:hypothetical protein F5Y01DRAFT_195975 [Xylaria sp. FL0043]|nr:hypothetical protein F5Y01DRAFT_195975 [Xylaria sp. FL0043]